MILAFRRLLIVLIIKAERNRVDLKMIPFDRKKFRIRAEQEQIRPPKKKGGDNQLLKMAH